MVVLMIRTGIPISVWEMEGEAVINTAFRVLFEQDHDINDFDDVQSLRDLGLMP